MSEGPALGELLDEPATSERLVVAGLSVSAAGDKARLLAKTAGALPAGGRAARTPVHAFFVPGRIEVLGKHTDYAGGRSMVAATERGFCFAAAARGDAQVSATDASSGQTLRFAMDDGLTPRSGHWGNYPMTVARRLARNFTPPLLGADVAFCSDLPPAAGMSSSSAIIVGTFLVLSRINRLSEREEYRRDINGPEALAGYLGTIENGQSFGSLAGDKGVGTFGGSEDHAAMLCCRAGTISQYSYCPVRFERFIDVPAGYVFAVAASGVAAEKTGRAQEKYNRASRLAAAVAERWREMTGRDDPNLAAAIAGSPTAVEDLRRVLSAAGELPELLNRFEHFLIESEQIIPGAGDALAVGDLVAFGELVDRSQRAAETLLGNQVPETIRLARIARELGAAAASAFGAGFGGSVWALIALQDAHAFLERWAEGYRRQFPASAPGATFFLTHAGPAAFEL